MNSMLNEPSSHTKMLQDKSPSSSLAREGGEEEHVNLYQEEGDESDDDDDDDDAMQQQQQQQQQQPQPQPQPESNIALGTTTTTIRETIMATTAATPLREEQQPSQQLQLQSSLIRCMPEQTVRRIVAGQAILDLASAVKELLDNALDAQSTCINIRLFNQGIDLLEVSDDGVGVPLHSRPYLCTPHATSKLESLDDLQRGQCQTLGFRGEALYSLANLSANVIIATRTRHEALAQKMEFNQQGHMVPESIVEMPRKVGTTVCVQDFLQAVPVRRADFLRRLPTQRSKLIHVCQGYALFCAAGSGSNHNNTSSSHSSGSTNSRQNNNHHHHYYRPPCQLRLMDMISRNDGSAEERIILQTPNQTAASSSSTSTSTTTPPTRGTVLLGRAISAILGTAVLQQLCEVSINVTDVVVAAAAAAAAMKKDSTTTTAVATAATAMENDDDDDDDDDDHLVNPDGTPRWTVAGFISKAQPPAATASLNNEGSNNNDSTTTTIRPSHAKASRRVGHIPTTNTGNPNQQPGNTTAASATAAAATMGHQFVCINGRPVEMPKLVRLLNEQWRSCHNNNNNNSNNNKDDATAKKTKTNKKRGGSSSSRVGRPSIILQFTIPFQAYDINLSPDKRQAVLLGEDDILQRIIQVVSSLWQSQTNTDHVQFQSFEESEAAVAAMSKAAAAAKSRNNSRSSSCCSSPEDINDNALLSPRTTADQLEGSGRFNRRYAFSHDVKKARLQHEFDDGRKKHDFANDDSDNDEEEEERRRPDYNNYQPGYGPDENDDQLDAMLWQQEQIKRQLQAQEKETQRQQQQAAAAALFAARQKEQASSSSSPRNHSATTNDMNSRDGKKQDAAATEECTTTSTTTATTMNRLTESSRLSIENAKTLQRIAAAVSTMNSGGGGGASSSNNVNITPSPPTAPPRQFLHVATITTTMTTPNDNDNYTDTTTAALSSCDAFMTRSNNNNNHAERCQWQATQQRFNHSRDDDDDDDHVVHSFGKGKASTNAAAGDDASSSLSSPLQSVLDRPPSTKGPPQKEDILLRLNQFRAAGAAIESTHNKSKKRSNSSITSTTSDLDKQKSSQPKTTARKKSPTFTLEQFGFQKSTSTTTKKTSTTTATTASTTRTSKPSSHHDDSLESALNGKRHKQNDDEPNDNSEEHESSSAGVLPVVSLHDQHASESTTTPPTAANSADANMDIQQKESPEQQDKNEQEEIAGRYQRKRKRLPAPVAASTVEDADERETTAAMNAVEDSRRSIAEENMNQSSGNIKSARTGTQPRLTSPAGVFPTPITWDAFGTNQVLLESRRERLAMHERKQSLQEMQQEHHNDSKHDQAGDHNLSASSSSSSRIVTLGKEDFKDMTVIGQFNKGFILTKSRNNHLWIMDQHACDEKYNFEKLVKETVIHEQRLIAPMPLELSSAEETCILDHMEIFEKNGFRFEYRENEAPRHRLALTALPHSGARDGRKAVLFGKEDVSALCMILGCGDDGNHIDDDDDYDDGNTLYQDGVAGGGTGTDGSGMYGNNAVRHAGRRGTAGSTSGNNGNDTADRVIARLPKAIAMFASRACRGSIMIGRALSSTEMQRIIAHLGEMDHPFTCAHGRPTMQHVSNIGPLLRQDEHKAAEHRAGPTVTVLSQEANDQNSDGGEER